MDWVPSGSKNKPAEVIDDRAGISEQAPQIIVKVIMINKELILNFIITTICVNESSFPLNYH